MHRLPPLLLLTLSLLALLPVSAQLQLTDIDQKIIKKIKEGKVISIRLKEEGEFKLHKRTIKNTDQVELKGVLGSNKDGQLQLKFVSARTYYKQGRIVGTHELLFDGAVDATNLTLTVPPADIVVLTLEKDRMRSTSLLVRSIGLLTFFAAPFVSLNLGSGPAIHSDTYLWVAGSGFSIMAIGALMTHISQPKMYLLKEVPFPETKKYKRAQLRLN